MWQRPRSGIVRWSRSASSPPEAQLPTSYLLWLVGILASLVMLNVLGTVVEHRGAVVAVMICAVATSGAGLLALLSAPLRTTRVGLTTVPVNR